MNKVERYISTRALPAASDWNSSTVPYTYVRAVDYDALAAEIERLNARVAELERDAQCFEWLAERLTDVIVDGADPTEHYDDGPNSATDLWRRAIRSAMAQAEKGDAL